jgi:ATP-binding cassette subfamily B protein
LTLLNAAVLVVTPLLMKRVVDDILASKGIGSILTNVVWIAALGVLHFLIYILLQGSRARLNARFDYGVRLRAFEYLSRMGPSFFARFRTGDLVTRLTDDVSEKLSWYMCSGLLRTLEAVALIGFGVAMMLRLSPELTLYAAGPLPVLIGIYIVTSTRLQARYQTVQTSISRLNDSLENVFSGIRVVKAFAAEPFQQALVADRVERQRAAEVRAVRWQTIIDSLYGHIWQFAIIGVLFMGGRMAMRDEITLGDLVAFDAYVLLLVWPMFDVGQFLVRGRLSAVSIDRLGELEEALPEVEEPLPPPEGRRPQDPPVDEPREPARLDLVQAPFTVRFEEVSFAHPGSDRPALTRVSLEARPSAVIAVVGEIGSGKSTVLNLLPRVVEPTSGRILVNGHDLRDLPLRAWRERVGTVPQEAILFSTSVRENIRFGRPWVSDDDIARAVVASGLADEVAAWPAGLDTLVGTRGVRLSGGQKQRTALARALAGSPDVLILDDATASLDAATEDAVWAAVHELLPRCTTFVVTHRPATLQRAAEIVVLDAGRVSERGSFAELQRPGTRFHALYLRWKLEDHAR